MMNLDRKKTMAEKVNKEINSPNSNKSKSSRDSLDTDLDLHE